MFNFLNSRAWIIFVGVEAVLAGVLWVIGLLHPILLILFGLLLLAALWACDNKREQAHALLRRLNVPEPASDRLFQVLEGRANTSMQKKSARSGAT